MTTIRPYRPEDKAAFVAMQDPTLYFPDPEDPLNRLVFVLEEEGEAKALLVGRITLEGHLVMAPGGSCKRMRWIRTIKEFALRKMYECGFAELHMFVVKRPEAKRWVEVLESMFGRDERAHVTARLRDHFV